MSGHTRIGSGLWDWEPFTKLDNDGRVLWLALYTSAPAKRNAPGLWHGSISTMADEAHMSPDLTIKTLDVLLDRDMAEFDPKLRVLRLTELPDCGESPANGKAIFGWWSKFTMTPVCAIRDAHVATLRWIIDEWVRTTSKTGVLSQDHQAAWAETFGKIVIPTPRRRGVRRLADNDTSTATQPSLFGTVSLPASSQPEDTSVDKSDVVRQLNDLTVPDTVCDTVSKPTGSGSGLGSGSGSSFSSSEADPPNDRPVERDRPRLVLVPPPAEAPFTPAQLVKELGPPPHGTDLEGLQVALLRAIVDCGRAGVGASELVILGQWVSGGGPAADAIDRQRLYAHAANSDGLADLFRRAREHKQAADERARAWQTAREIAGIT